MTNHPHPNRQSPEETEDQEILVIQCCQETHLNLPEQASAIIK
jgi:hypothetical protein